MCGTTGLSAEPGRRRRCSTTRAIAGASTLRGIWLKQADAYDGYNKLYLAGRSPGPILEAACWVHARRPFFAMADIEENARRKAAGKKEIALSPIAIEIVRRIDALFEIERSINGKSAEERLAVRQISSRPLVEDLNAYMRAQLARLAPGNDLTKAINYILKRWASFTLFLQDGRVCPLEQRCRKRVEGYRPRSEIMAVLRVGPRRTARRSHVPDLLFGKPYPLHRLVLLQGPDSSSAWIKTAEQRHRV